MGSSLGWVKPKTIKFGIYFSAKTQHKGKRAKTGNVFLRTRKCFQILLFGDKKSFKCNRHFLLKNEGSDLFSSFMRRYSFLKLKKPTYIHPLKVKLSFPCVTL